MRRRIGIRAEAQAVIAAALQGQLTEGQADRLAVLGPEAVKLALLATAKRIAEQCLTIAELQTKLKVANPICLSTPSGRMPIYAKRRL